MSLRVLSAEEIKEHYDTEFAKLVPGQFFKLQYGFFQPPVYRVFFVKERRPDGKSVIVYELSNLANRGAMNTDGQLVEAMYRYKPDDCINIIHTTFGPESSPGYVSKPGPKKQKTIDTNSEFDLAEFEEYLSSESGSDIDIVT